MRAERSAPPSVGSLFIGWEGNGPATSAAAMSLGYAPEVSDKVYALMVKRTATSLRNGCSVIADAVFDVPDRRQAIEDAAVQVGAPFGGIWLQANPKTLRHRIETRPKAASDATEKVLKRQLARDVSTMNWEKITTSGGLEETIAETRSWLEL